MTAFQVAGGQAGLRASDMRWRISAPGALRSPASDAPTRDRHLRRQIDPARRHYPAPLGHQERYLLAMDADNPTPGPVVAGGQRLAAAVRAHFAVEAGLVYDASQSDPADWDALDTELNEVFRLTKQAVIDRVPIVYVLHEPSIWGHDTPLRAALATALLGGVRSVAVEGVRNEIVANAVSMSGDAEVERAASTVAWLLEGQLSGQLLTCGSAHLGRPAA